MDTKNFYSNLSNNHDFFAGGSVSGSKFFVALNACGLIKKSCIFDAMIDMVEMGKRGDSIVFEQFGENKDMSVEFHVKDDGRADMFFLHGNELVMKEEYAHVSEMFPILYSEWGDTFEKEVESDEVYR